MATADTSEVNPENGGGRHLAAANGGERGSSSSSSDSGGGRPSREEEESEIVGVSEKGRVSSASECSVEVDLEAGVNEVKVHLAESGRDCRICHLSMDASNQGPGASFLELGCSCKEDLAAAHKHCAEVWFKIKGNKTCEICGSTARNVVGQNEVESTEQWDAPNEVVTATAVAPMQPSEARNFWKGHRFLNFLLACMVFAFVISWLFHFNIPS